MLSSRLDVQQHAVDPHILGGDSFRTPPDTHDFTLGQANIAGDFRGTGVLALKGMVFFCEHYERKASGPSDRETRAQPSTPTHIETNHTSPAV